MYIANLGLVFWEKSQRLEGKFSLTTVKKSVKILFNLCHLCTKK